METETSRTIGDRSADYRFVARRWQLPVLGALCALAVGCSRNSPETAELLVADSGGATTIHETNRNSFSQPAANLEVEKRGEFFIGNAFFNSAWVVAPASAG